MKRFGLCFFVVFQVEVDDGFDAFLPEVYWHVFVGGVDGVGFQTEAHEEALYAEFFLEGGDDWNAAADAHGQWSFAEYLFEAAFGCFVCGEVDGADVAVAAVEHFYFYFDGVWCYFVEVIDDELSDFLVVLMWDEA